MKGCVGTGNTATYRKRRESTPCTRWLLLLLWATSRTRMKISVRACWRSGRRGRSQTISAFCVSWWRRGCSCGGKVWAWLATLFLFRTQWWYLTLPQCPCCSILTTRQSSGSREVRKKCNPSVKGTPNLPTACSWRCVSVRSCWFNRCRTSRAFWFLLFEGTCSRKARGWWWKWATNWWTTVHRSGCTLRLETRASSSQLTLARWSVSSTIRSLVRVLRVSCCRWWSTTSSLTFSTRNQSCCKTRTASRAVWSNWRMSFWSNWEIHREISWKISLCSTIWPRLRLSHSKLPKAWRNLKNSMPSWTSPAISIDPFRRKALCSSSK